MLKYFNKNKYTKGVTLIELLVVIAIIGVITVVTLADYGKYRSSMPTQNLVDDIALSVRKTQGYAVGVKGAGTSFNYGYGIHISAGTDISNPSAGSRKAFVIFKDMKKDGKYTKDSSTTCGTPSEQNECLEILSITSSDVVSMISILKDGTRHTGTGDIDIIFERPNPEPTFCYKNNQVDSACQVDSDKISLAEISVGTFGNMKSVTVWKNGQISVD